MTRKPKPDSLVVITMLTSNAERRDRIDLAIDKAFYDDKRVKVVRVVGYLSADEISKLSR